MNTLQKYIKMFREDIRNAMSYRCGLDELNNFLMLIGFIYIIVALFSHDWIFTIIGAVFVVLSYLRVFSKNLEKRKKENDVYMHYMGAFVIFTRRMRLVVKMKIKTMRDPAYAYFVCKKCHQVIRVPKGKNKINIRCPKCDSTFVKRT